METLGTKTSIKILKSLLDTPLKEFNELELIKKAKTGKGSSSDVINHLVNEGIILEKRAGKTKILSLNKQNSTTFSLKLLFDKEKLKKLNTVQLATIIFFKESIKEYAELLVIFGSSIAGTATAESDVDILLSSNNLDKVESQRKIAEELFGQRLNIHHLSKEDLKKKISEDSFLQNAFIKGSILHGFSFAKQIFSSFGKKKDIERLLYFNQRIKSALRNYLDKDYDAVKEILQKTIEQIIFYILTEKSVSYTSKKDAEESIKKIGEGKIISKINKAKLSNKIQLLETFVLELIKERLIQNEGYFIK